MEFKELKAVYMWGIVHLCKGNWLHGESARLGDGCDASMIPAFPGVFYGSVHRNGTVTGLDMEWRLYLGRYGFVVQ